MKQLYDSIHGVTKTVEETVEATDTLIAPVRVSLFKRFPTAALFLVTFGVAATILGIERIIESIPFFNSHPFAILICGIAILFVTGRLYKKLG